MEKFNCDWRCTKLTTIKLKFLGIKVAGKSYDETVDRPILPRNMNCNSIALKHENVNY